MKSLDNIKYMLCDELDELAEKGELSVGDLETIHTLTDTIKNIHKIKSFEDGEYSQGYMPYGRNYSIQSYNGYGNSYDDGMRYDTRHSEARNPRNNRMYSYAEAKEDITMQIEQMMNDGKISASDRNTLREAVKTIRNMK